MTDIIYTVSINSAIHKHLKLADRARKRLSTAKNQSSPYCLELRKLEKLHREVARFIEGWR